MDENVCRFVEDVRRAVASSAMEQKELAFGLGVSPQHLNAVLNGRANLSRRLEEGLCRTLGVAPLASPVSPVSHGWWAPGSGRSGEAAEKCALSGVALPGTGVRGEGGYMIVPLRGGVPSHVALRQDWLACKANGLTGGRTGRGKLFLVRMEGDAMRPDIPDGALVLVDGGQCEPAHGRVFYVRYDGVLCFRRLHVEPGRVVAMHGETGEAGAPEDGERVEILGRALWCCGDL